MVLCWWGVLGGEFAFFVLWGRVVCVGGLWWAFAKLHVFCWGVWVVVVLGGKVVCVCSLWRASVQLHGFCWGVYVGGVWVSFVDGCVSLVGFGVGEGMIDE